MPTYHSTGKKKYVDFYALDPATGELRRKKYHVDSAGTAREQKRMAAILIETITKKLTSGWNPWATTENSRSYTEMSEILSRYHAYVDRMDRVRTRYDYKSKAKMLTEYNESRKIPIRYAYQFDRSFVNDFLDWVLLDRGASARTRNNYALWCSSFCEFMKERKYIPDNPATGIAKLRETPKKRQPLNSTHLAMLRRHLEETDRAFLLACLMEYYTFIRPAELSALKVGDVNIKEMRVFISSSISKNRRDLNVGLNRSIVELMLELGVLSAPTDYYLFGKGFRPAAKKEKADQFGTRWAVMRRELGWGDELQFYSLKDSGIRDLANSEGIVIARDQARHSDISTTNKYLQGRDSTVHKEVTKFRGEL